MMTNPKPVFVIAGGILLFVVLTQIIPWQALIMIAFVVLMLFAFLGYLQQIAKERAAAIPHYQPPQQSSKPEPPPRVNPPLNFDLTAQEYQQLSKQYQQGLLPQEQKPMGAAGAGSWSPFTGFTPASNQANGSQLKQEHPSNYEQPQAEYPQQMPPMA